MRSNRINPFTKNILSAVIVSVLPDVLGLNEESGLEVQNDVINFVAGQVESLPRFLFLPYCSLLLIFNYACLLFKGNFFTELVKIEQLNYLRMWSYSKLRFMRDFIKLIRSCSLLRYYDHPLITKEMYSLVQNQ